VEWLPFGASDEKPDFELYDYMADPLESKNLAAEQPEIVGQLRSILAKYPRPAMPAKPPQAR
jgi:iduronate 2-sulfatase